MLVEPLSKKLLSAENNFGYEMFDFKFFICLAKHKKLLVENGI